MNKNINHLTAIAQKETRHIIGLMSGTSLDGLDIAHCAVSGSGVDTNVKLLHFDTVPYPSYVKDEIRKVFAKPMVDFRHLCLLHPWLAGLHAQWILECLEKWKLSPSSVDLIASHGQTVYHCPKILHKQQMFGDATLQIVDGDHIAVKTGIITLSDFRQKHIAAGGEGAPLALYGDYCIFSKAGENRIMLNMGGIANFTYLPGNLNAAEVFVTDTGPGNTLIDAFTQKYFQQDYDRDAMFALQGKVNETLLLALKKDDFFKTGFPKTTGPELFNMAYVQQAQQDSNTTDISPYDMLATVTRFSADTIIAAVKAIIKSNEEYKIYMSGGGAHNPLLTQWLKEGLPQVGMSRTDELGINGDAKEAVLFAILANEAIAGKPIDWGERKGMPAVTMGKLSFPY